MQSPFSLMANKGGLFNLAVALYIALVCLVNAAPTAREVELDSRSHCASDTGGVHIIAARGSTEPPGEGALGTISGMIKSAIPGSTSRGVNYPALLSPYQWSADTGTAALNKEIEDYVARCPRSRIILTGYSQGGQIVMNSLCGTNEWGFTPTSQLPQHLWKHIAAAMVFADPSHLPGQPYDMGTSELQGMFPRQDPSLCMPFAKRLQAYCDVNDPVCASGSDESVHTSYFEKYNDEAAQWLVSKAKAHLPWLRHHDH